jgi:hypothetical protein
MAGAPPPNKPTAPRPLKVPHDFRALGVPGRASIFTTFVFPECEGMPHGFLSGIGTLAGPSRHSMRSAGFWPVT